MFSVIMLTWDEISGQKVVATAATRVVDGGCLLGGILGVLKPSAVPVSISSRRGKPPRRIIGVLLIVVEVEVEVTVFVVLIVACGVAPNGRLS